MTTRIVRVDADAAARLDALVHALLPDVSRRIIRALIAEGAVTVNGRPARKGARVTAGDVVELPTLAGLAPEPDLPLDVLYVDDEVVVVNKPGGVPAHALDPRERGTIGGALLARHPELGAVGDPLSAGLVHRLDTGTSGVLVAARSPAAYATWRAAFRRHEVVKHYVAIVDGAPAAGAVVDTPLAHDPSDRRRMRPARAGDRAWPTLSVVGAVEPHGGRSRVEVEIRTGVTHQVRAHLALLGSPIVGDVLYGGATSSLAPGRHALHAARLTWSAHDFDVAAPLPADLAALLA